MDMKKRAYRTHLLAELRELNTTLRRIAATAEVDSKRGLAADETARDTSADPVQ